MKRTFADIATAIAHLSGRPITFLLAAFIIIVWAITGPIFHYSDTWQLIINTGTTIITFLYSLFKTPKIVIPRLFKQSLMNSFE